jgi:CRP/FNR family transcriptional regulator
MAERMRQMVALVGDVVFERLDARLASRLSELFEESNGNWVTITHEQLATELGTTREVISRMLKYLETQTGCIKLHRGRIELLSFSRLLQWAK